MRPRATLQDKVEYGLRACQNPFTDRTWPAGRMLPMLALNDTLISTEKSAKYLEL